MPFIDLRKEADTRPTIFVHLSEVFHTLKIHGEILPFLLGSLLANRVSLVDVINAKHLQIVGALSGKGRYGCGDESK
jgi:hypothetical protein